VRQQIRGSVRCPGEVDAAGSGAAAVHPADRFALASAGRHRAKVGVKTGSTTKVIVRASSKR
jgi:hypothetical protein